MKLKDIIKAEYTSRYSNDPIMVRAPGRINMIGEHTDYNSGFVMPAAIDKGIYFAIEKSEKENCSLYSYDNDETFNLSLDSVRPVPTGWQNYILGVVAEIQKRNREIQPFQLVFGGDIPQGAGLSSSAALECGTALALNELFDLGFTSKEMALMSQQAEHKFAGVKCGIMDQFASIHGRKNEVILLDCKTLDYQYYPADLQGFELVLCNSNVTHNLASSEYNIRREQCEFAVGEFKKINPAIKSLRDVTERFLTTHGHILPPLIYKRCKYVVEENERVLAFGRALKKGNVNEMGSILKQAHQGMKTEYEVTCEEIDYLVNFANRYPGVIGSRMTGGGFGGCTLNIVRNDAVDKFLEEINHSYNKEFGIDLEPIRVSIENGAEVLHY